MLLWLTIGFPAVYLGTGTVIAAMVHAPGPPISLHSWLYLMRAWPRVMFIDIRERGF